MAQYIQKDILVAEIERLKADALQKKGQCKRSGLEKIMHQIGVYNKILSFFNTLEVKEVDEEPVSEELEEEIEQYCLRHGYLNTFKDCGYTFNEQVGDIARHFAKWQKQQDQSTIELAEDHAMLAGMEKMKEEMMAKAIDVEVHVDAGGYPYIPQMELYDYDKDVPLAKEGKKVKVIVIKEK